MRDILQDDDGDIKLVDGDIQFGEATGQHQRTLLQARPGDIRTAPLVGVDLTNYLEDNNPNDMFQAIRTQFARDGMKVKSVKIVGGKLAIDAHYKGDTIDYASAKEIVFNDSPSIGSDYQSIINIAIQEYGNIDAIMQIVKDNDLTGNMNQPGFVGLTEIDLGYSLNPDVVLVFDTTSTYYNARVLEGLKEDNGKGVKVKRIIADGLSYKKIFSSHFTGEFK